MSIMELSRTLRGLLGDGTGSGRESLEGQGRALRGRTFEQRLGELSMNPTDILKKSTPEAESLGHVIKKWHGSHNRLANE